MIYVMSDIHGCDARYRDILTKSGIADTITPKRRSTGCKSCTTTLTFWNNSNRLTSTPFRAYMVVHLYR